MPAWAESMLASYLSQAGLDRVFINSTMRTAEEQAAAMYNNEMRGNRISYGSAGRSVIAQMDLLPGFPAATVIAAMASRLRELEAQGQLVSYHCDTAPRGFTAADMDPGSVGGVGSPSYNAFLRVLRSAKNRGELKELLSPDAGTDPAIHVVFIEGTLARAQAATENALSVGVSSSFEGQDSPGGLPVWALVGGAAVATVLLLKGKRK